MRRLLTKKQVRELTTLAFSSIDREERAGRFPTRVAVSCNRVAWWEDKVLLWLDGLLPKPLPPLSEE